MIFKNIAKKIRLGREATNANAVSFPLGQFNPGKKGYVKLNRLG